ncbi:MAG: hypothetical protein WDZ53_11000, partial [Balneolales bacterium]
MTAGFSSWKNRLIHGRSRVGAISHSREYNAVALLCFTVLIFGCEIKGDLSTADKPNIVIFLVDDMGYGD